MSKILKEIESEIQWYGPPYKIRTAMRKLGALGLSPSGHGKGVLGEDWSLSKNFDSKGENYVYVSLESGKQLTASVTVWLRNKSFHRDINNFSIVEIIKYTQIGLDLCKTGIKFSKESKNSRLNKRKA